MRFFQDEVDLTVMFSDVAMSRFPTLPIDWPTVKTLPAAEGEYEGMMLRFIVSRLAGGSRFVATQGDIRHYRNYGSVLLQVIGPSDEGSGRLLKVADLVGSALQGKRLGGMLTRTPSAGPIIVANSSSSVTVDVPYQSDFKADREGNVLP